MRTFILPFAFFIISAGYAFAASDSPVTILSDDPSSRTTTVVTNPNDGTTKITVEDQPVVYDAITGEPVDPEEALGNDQEEEPKSLRDEVRGKMKMLE